MRIDIRGKGGFVITDAIRKYLEKRATRCIRCLQSLQRNNES